MLDLIRSPNFTNPMMKVGLLMFLVELGGVNLLSQYMIKIFTDAGSSIDSTLAPIFVAAIRTLIGSFGALILRYCPRRKLILGTILLTACSFTALGYFSYTTQNNKDVIARINCTKGPNYEDHLELAVATQALHLSSYGWIPMLSVMAVQACEAIALVPILHLALPAESFPTEVRAVGCGFCGIVIAVTRFIILKAFPLLVAVLHFHVVMYMFALIIMILFACTLVIVPENKGQSLVQTEDKMVAVERIVVRPDFQAYARPYPKPTN